MSECVVRMTLPKGCVWRDDKGNIKMCPLYWEDEARCQGKDGKEAPWYDGKRPDWCPIICKLPEGHGRLGDLDELDAAISDEIDESGWDNAGFTGYRVWSKVDEAPTIVPADTAERSEK